MECWRGWLPLPMPMVMLTADADDNSGDDADDADDDADDADDVAGDDAMLLRSSSACEADEEIEGDDDYDATCACK